LVRAYPFTACRPSKMILPGMVKFSRLSNATNPSSQLDLVITRPKVGPSCDDAGNVDSNLEMTDSWRRKFPPLMAHLTKRHTFQSFGNLEPTIRLIEPRT